MIQAEYIDYGILFKHLLHLAWSGAEFRIHRGVIIVNGNYKYGEEGTNYTMDIVADAISEAMCNKE